MTPRQGRIASLAIIAVILIVALIGLFTKTDFINKYKIRGTVKEVPQTQLISAPKIYEIKVESLLRSLPNLWMDPDVSVKDTIKVSIGGGWLTFCGEPLSEEEPTVEGGIEVGDKVEVKGYYTTEYQGEKEQMIVLACN